MSVEQLRIFVERHKALKFRKDEERSMSKESMKEATADDVGLTLSNRRETHGEFTDNARVMQALKDIVRTGGNWPGFARLTPIKELSPVQREVIDMILLKIGRIVTGNPNELDHWLDIEGYARLARERID